MLYCTLFLYPYRSVISWTWCHGILCTLLKACPAPASSRPRPSLHRLRNAVVLRLPASCHVCAVRCAARCCTPLEGLYKAVRDEDEVPMSTFYSSSSLVCVRVCVHNVHWCTNLASQQQQSPDATLLFVGITSPTPRPAILLTLFPPCIVRLGASRNSSSSSSSNTLHD